MFFLGATRYKHCIMELQGVWVGTWPHIPLPLPIDLQYATVHLLFFPPFEIFLVLLLPVKCCFILEDYALLCVCMCEATCMCPSFKFLRHVYLHMIYRLVQVKMCVSCEQLWESLPQQRLECLEGWRISFVCCSEWLNFTFKGQQTLAKLASCHNSSKRDLVVMWLSRDIENKGRMVLSNNMVKN